MFQNYDIQDDHNHAILDVVAGTKRFRAQVMSGKGLATGELGQMGCELREIVGETLCPGSLNLIFRKPVRLKQNRARAFDEGRRLLWPAELNGRKVWIYRWPDAHLHEVEILSSEHLRSRFALSDGDEVVLSIAASDVDRLALISRLAWGSCWLGRRERFYTDDAYYDRMVAICRNYDATQREPGKSLSEMLKALLKTLAKRVPGAIPLVRALRDPVRK